MQQAQLAYQPAMRGTKIIYPHFADRPSFALDEAGFFSNNKTFFVASGDLYLLGLLNSRALWFVFGGSSTAVRGGFREHATQWIEQLPVPDAGADVRAEIGARAERASKAACEALALEREVQRRIPDLCPPGRTAKLTGRLQAWWTLDFAGFRAEVQKAFRADVPLRERGDWEAYLDGRRTALRDQVAIVQQAERMIDQAVNDLFGLTPAEVTLLAT